jgi:peptidoglycan/LPS O-acetylase OafA/YrhL
VIHGRFFWIVPYVVTGAGHQAVIVFFLLSGFLVGGTVLRAVERGEWKWTTYLLRRSTRLWIVLVPALILCFIWDKSGLSFGYAPGLYGGHALNHMLGNVSQLLSRQIFLANLFFLQGIHAPTYGSDGALWSLAFEFWYYLLFPLGLFAFFPYFRLRYRIAYFVLFLAASYFVRGGILYEFPIWLAGVLLLKVPSLRPHSGLAKIARLVAPIAYVPVFFFLAKAHILPSLVSDYVLAAFTFLLMWILLSATNAHPERAVPVLFSRWIARFSYTLYAVHTPLLVFLASILVRDARWQPTWNHVLIGLIVLFAVVAYSFGIAFLTEFRTDVFRVRLEKILGLQQDASSLSSDPKEGEVPAAVPEPEGTLPGAAN